MTAVYPPDHHLLRELRFSFDHDADGRRSRAWMPVVSELCTDLGHARAGALALDLHARLQALGVYEPERRKWLSHVTVIRFRRRPRLQPPLPELEPFVPSDAAAYLSHLRPGGAQYEVLESMRVGGR